MTRDHVIVLPGGGYSRISDNESTTIVAWLESLGLSASYFAYPVETRHPAVLDAVRGEIRRVRSTGVERVALLGFSAGGHAAGHGRVEKVPALLFELVVGGQRFVVPGRAHVDPQATGCNYGQGRGDRVAHHRAGFKHQDNDGAAFDCLGNRSARP